ncbi:MAG: homocysteine S-methyltransferase family protein, partial [Xanthomonadales bacterium]|nr:homocysteine S-methyltransferase family protein [Xanthomonadales bacterium]
MNNPLQVFLDRQGFAVLDGGLATELETRGADLNHELWSARLLYEAPEMIEKVHYDFLQAGADVIATASYQASIEGFERVGHKGQRARDLIGLSVDLALQAREAFWSVDHQRQGRLRPLVAASIGPYGACLADGSEYHGEYGVGKQELLEFHRPRIALLADSGADLFAYLGAARAVDARFTLVENWRSTPDLLAAVERLYTRGASPFVLE